MPWPRRASSPARTSQIDVKEKYCQVWGTAAYLMCARTRWQPIHYPELLENMKAAVINEAKQKNVSLPDPALAPQQRYGLRLVPDHPGGAAPLHRSCHRHRRGRQRRLFKAMILEADYGLGRNPMNMVQMTGLGSRAVEDIYTTGRNDGTPGVHPGHTPYMNADAGASRGPTWPTPSGTPPRAIRLGSSGRKAKPSGTPATATATTSSPRNRPCAARWPAGLPLFAGRDPCGQVTGAGLSAAGRG